MASHVQGIAITIKAFLPTGKTLDEQFAALSIVKDAHASGDYSKVLAAAKIDEVKAEQKTRRVEDTAPLISSDGTQVSHGTETDQSSDTSGDQTEQLSDAPYDEPTDESVPEFIKASRKRA